MTGSHNFHVWMMRSVLRQARIDNARLTAAAIGGKLSKISATLGSDPHVSDAVEEMRDSTFDFLRALSQGEGIVAARQAALQSVDQLETRIAAAATVPPPAPPPPSISAVRRIIGRLRAATPLSLSLARH